MDATKTQEAWRALRERDAEAFERALRGLRVEDFPAGMVWAATIAGRTFARIALRARHNNHIERFTNYAQLSTYAGEWAEPDDYEPGEYLDAIHLAAYNAISPDDLEELALLVPPQDADEESINLQYAATEMHKALCAWRRRHKRL